MMVIIPTAILGLVALWTFFTVARWKRNYREALVTGFPVYYSPIHISSISWMLLSGILLPVFNLLPRSWTTPWLSISQNWQIWKLGYLPFEEAQADTFILATPYGNMLWSSDNSVIRDLFTQHPKVDLPVEFLSFWDVWGPTIGSVTGDSWKIHRRAVTSGFGPDMHKIVWKETQHQTETLASYWIHQKESLIPVVRHWTSRLALHVISSGFFNKRIEWDDDDGQTRQLPQGHYWTLDKALPTLIERLAVLFMVPRKLLGHIPGEKFKEAHTSFMETTKYFEEYRADTLNNLENVMGKKNKTILESIVISGVDTERNGKQPLPKESVLGNIFFTLLAGHETTGGTLGFIILLLAIYPDYQKRIQEELDNQLGQRPKNEWTVEKDFYSLQEGLVGAVQKEVLYIFNPASFFMRKTLEETSVLDSTGKSHLIPRNTLALINNAGAARSPKNWDKAPVPVERAMALSNSPALYFNPERWMIDHEPPRDSGTGENRKASSKWTAFGAGGRACPGRMFAQIELVAAVATLYKDYSLNLVVEEQMVQEFGEARAWEKTRDRVIKMLYDEIEANISIGIYKETPLRITKRAI